MSYAPPPPQGQRPPQQQYGAPPQQGQQQYHQQGQQQQQYPPQQQQQQYPPQQQQYPPQQQQQYPPQGHQQQQQYPPQGQQQQQQHQVPPAPPGADPQLWYWFSAIDTDRSGRLSAPELSRALVNGDWKPFDIGTVAMLIRMFDRDVSGTVDFNEFSSLWKYIDEWKKCFRTFDRDGSGTIDRNELRHALHNFGYRISEETLQSVVRRLRRDNKSELTFDHFIQACVMIRSLTESFRKVDTDQDGWVNINYDQFLQLAMDNV
ncbi:MAG: hypothetical protein DHS80DRAFT_12471 [Piptocephalis tieghemiana]|nr:MAG: hypothetical protein DHS80DRAFT_12471 [Piptocephalis tieghemiana]